MKGASPPSSSTSRFTVLADWRNNSLPTSVEPVKESTRTRSSSVHAPTISGAWPVTTLKTPRGSPARSASTASAVAENGVSIDGCATTVQPAASAAAALRVSMAAGKFHGVMSAATPAGSRHTSTSASGRCEVTLSMLVRLASSA